MYDTLNGFEFYLYDQSRPFELVKAFGPEGTKVAKRGTDGEGRPSVELVDDWKSDGTVGGVACARRIMDHRKFWDAYYKSVTHQRCCDVKARGIVLNGFELEGEAKDTPDGEAIEAMLRRSRYDLFKAARDWEVTGYAGLECIEYEFTREGLFKLNHLDSWTLHRATDRQRVVQKREGPRTAVFQLVDAADDFGLPVLAWTDNKPYPYSQFYGVPDVMSALVQIDAIYEGIKLIREFFQRRAGYRWLLLIKSPAGAEDATDDKNLIKQIHLHTSKMGKESPGAPDILTLPIGNRTVEFHQLDGDMTSLAFGDYVDMYRDDLFLSHGVAPSVAGLERTGALSGDQASEQRKNYRDETIAPKQLQWEGLLNAVVEHYWPGRDIRVVLKDPEIDERQALASSWITAWSSGAITLDEFRAGALGEGPEDDPEIGKLRIHELPLASEFDVAAVQQRAEQTANKVAEQRRKVGSKKE